MKQKSAPTIKDIRIKYVLECNLGGNSIEVLTIEDLESGMLTNIYMGLDHDGRQPTQRIIEKVAITPEEAEQIKREQLIHTLQEEYWINGKVAIELVNAAIKTYGTDWNRIYLECHAIGKSLPEDPVVGKQIKKEIKTNRK